MQGRDEADRDLMGERAPERLGTSRVWSGNTYVFLFTDVEGSTRRWQADPDAMVVMLARHDRDLTGAVAAHGGRVFKKTGDGICAVFPSAAEAVRAAIDAQHRLELPVRMAVHAGEAQEREGDFDGVALSRCARLMDAAHGGQVLLSASAASLAADVLGSSIALRDLGEHRLRDLNLSDRVFQAVAPGLRGEFPSLRSLDAVRHNLPILRSAFVGREVELSQVSERLLAGQFVTLTGMGGSGKTRLALEAAAHLVEQFPQGVFFIDLAVVSDPDLIGQAVASALRLHMLDSSVEHLAGYLAGRRVLLLMDNCEHLLDPCAQLIDTLLARCPDLHVLATSREALGLDGEFAYAVPSLGIETDAVSLFLDRARAVRPGFEMGTEAEGNVAEICRRLDGIPLAIELAAARSTHLAPAQILERLSDRFRLLTGGRRRVPRQQTLAAAIEWSHDLLSEAEQTLLRRLAVFRGSFSLRAVEEVCHPDALDLLGSLVTKSLVIVQEEDAVARYRLAETMRLYAEERLVAAGEAAQRRSAHRDWYVGWLESFPVGELLAPGAGHQLVPEADNLTAALDWSLEQERPDLIVRIASRMIGYWWSYMRVAEMAAWWRALEVELPKLTPDLRAAALLVGLQHAVAVGDFDEMERLSADAVATAAPDSWVAAYAWSRQALYWTYADPERGRRCIEAGRRASAAADVPEFDMMTASSYANLITGQPAQDDALGIREVIDDLVAAPDSHLVVNNFTLLGTLAVLGDTERAARLASTHTPQSPLELFSRGFLAALIASSEGQTRAMSEHLQALTTLVREFAIPLGEASCLIGFAALAIDENDVERASRLLATVRSAARFPFRTPLEVLVYRRCVQAVGRALDSDAARLCRAEGAATPIDDALDAELGRLGAATPLGLAHGA
jgi:predicted ATPase/class 3 adenylate cyclase